MAKENNKGSNFLDVAKAVKGLGQDTVDEMDAMDPTELKQTIVSASSAMKEVKEELEANPKYQSLKADLNHLTQGKRDVDKRQKAKISYSLLRLEAFDVMTPADKSAWRKTSEETKARLEKQKRELAQKELQNQLKANDKMVAELSNLMDLGVTEITHIKS